MYPITHHIFWLSKTPNTLIFSSSSIFSLCKLKDDKSAELYELVLFPTCSISTPQPGSGHLMFDVVILWQEYIFRLEPGNEDSGKGKCPYDPKLNSVSALISEYHHRIYSFFHFKCFCSLSLWFSTNTMIKTTPPLPTELISKVPSDLVFYVLLPICGEGMPDVIFSVKRLWPFFSWDLVFFCQHESGDWLICFRLLHILLFWSILWCLGDSWLEIYKLKSRLLKNDQRLNPLSP